MATVTRNLIDRSDVQRDEAAAAATADGYELLNEQVVLRFALRLAAPRASSYQTGSMLRYASRYHEFLRGDRRSKPAPGEYAVDPASAKLLRALVERLVEQARTPA